jgi:hypothetical protein
MKAKKILDETTNRGEFNRAYKYYLKNTGKIRYTYCRYNSGENGMRKFYGIDTRINKLIPTRYPNWKLVSKNRKQWMKKPTKEKIQYFRGYNQTYIRIIW